VTRPALALALLAAGCAAQRAVAPPPAAPAPSPALKWVRTSAEYRALTTQIYREATIAVTRRAGGLAPRTWVVIADADETLLDNSLEAKERAGRRFEPSSWAAFVRRRVSTAVPGARAFLDAVRGQGGLVAVVTNRDEELCDDTRENLRAEALAFDVVLCRVGGHSPKGPRFERVASGEATPGTGPLEVVAYVGDNIQDFPGGSQAVRDGPESALEAFGERYFLLPNPVYGSWERNAER
jgi:5'-nucleotidase (lipoprotein e(P4) family)